MKINSRFLTGLLSCMFLANASATILLNEVHARTPLSTDALPADGNYEFVELRSTLAAGIEVTADAGGAPLWRQCGGHFSSMEVGGY
jgi:hypothetical protein